VHYELDKRIWCVQFGVFVTF